MSTHTPLLLLLAAAAASLAIPSAADDRSGALPATVPAATNAPARGKARTSLPNFDGIAQSFQDPDGQTDVQADELEYSFADTGAEAGWTTFKGHAAIRYKGYQLRADRIRYNSKTGDAQASGNVVLTGADGTLWKGDTLTVNLRDRAGRADRIDLFTRPFRVLADDGAFAAPTRSNQLYRIDGATITTCTNEPGHFHWQVHASRARVRPNDDVTGWGVVPRLFGVPFFYVPYYWRDLERNYGFRFQPGFKHSWGAYLLSTYKLPIVRDKQNDSYIDSYTFADFRGKRGWGFGEKIAWEFGEKASDSKGYVTGWYMPEDEDLPTMLDPDDTERYRIRLNHYWNATDFDQVLLQALYVSDVRIQKDFFRKEYREMTEPDNYAAYTHYADAYSAGLTARFRLNDFYGQVERLPEAWLTLNSLELGESGLYLENDTAAAFLRRRFAGPATWSEIQAGKTEPDGYDAFRGDTRFELSYPRKYLGFLSVVPRLAWRGTYYDKTRRAVSSSNLVETVQTDLFGNAFTSVVSKAVTTYEEEDADFRSVFEIGSEVSTRAYGYWDEATGRQWRHVVEPYANWTFIPEPNLLPDEIWQFDGIDRIDKRDTLRIGLRQRWQYRDGEADPREMFYLDLWGDLNLEPEDEEEALSVFGWDGRYHPASWMSFTAKGRYDFDAELLDRAEFVLSAWHDIFRCDVEYLFREDRDNLFSGYVTWYPNEHWGFDLFGRYEFEESLVEEVGGWLQYRWDCLALRLIASVEPSYTNEYGEEEETDWHVTLTGWLTDFVPAKILEEDNR